MKLTIKMINLVLIVFFLLTNLTFAEESKITSLAKFTAGVASAYLIHEAGHFAAAKLTGTHIDIDYDKNGQLITFAEYTDNHSSGKIIHSSGLITQLAMSEVILQNDNIDKNDSFIRGVMFWNIINPIMYSVDYWFIHRQNYQVGNSTYGDIQSIEGHSDKQTANIFAGIMTLVATYQGYRYAKTQSWAPKWMQNDKAYLTCQQTGNKGVLLKMNFTF